MKPDAWFWIDVGSEFVLVGGTAMIGYMTALGGPVMPSTAAVLVAVVTGLIGVANHIRALRKAV